MKKNRPAKARSRFHESGICKVREFTLTYAEFDFSIEFFRMVRSRLTKALKFQFDSKWWGG